MTFKVVLTDPAFRDVEEAADFIWLESPAYARRWLVEFWEALETLNDLPLRHALIPEADDIGIPCRARLFHSHRIIYWVLEDLSIIYILRVYHKSRRPLTSEDVQH